MAYSELPWRPCLGHQAWSWTTLRRSNVFYYVYKRFFYFCHVFTFFNVFIFIWTFFTFMTWTSRTSFSLTASTDDFAAGCVSPSPTVSLRISAWASIVVLPLGPIVVQFQPQLTSRVNYWWRRKPAQQTTRSLAVLFIHRVTHSPSVLVAFLQLPRKPLVAL